VKDSRDILSLTSRIQALPQDPGVYLMKDREGRVLYVGKAKNLKTRVRSYFQKQDGRINTQILAGKVCTVDTVVTLDERQALILEADLIRKLKPKYNIRLKDDKAHCLVRVDLSKPFPRLEIVRKVEKDGARYFGPYAFGYELRTLMEVINRTIPLRTCTDRVMHNRVRPCLEYQIKRCAGPCCFDVDVTEYSHWVKQAMALLEGKNKSVIQELEYDMEQASEEERYEDAALIRDRIVVLKKMLSDKPDLKLVPGARDAFGLYRVGSDVEITLVKVRQGRLSDAKTFGFDDVEFPNDELLGSFLSQYYLNSGDYPDEILLPFDMEDSREREIIFSEKAGFAVRITTPQKGHKMRLIDLASNNAEGNFAARHRGQGGEEILLRALKKELSLEEIPRTIECIDISHFQGDDTVGSVVAFKDGYPDKSRYRRFKLSEQGKPDDFSSIREVVLRHLSRQADEATYADLLIIDGGAGQLSSAMGARKELGLRQPALIGLAKKRNIKNPYFKGTDKFQQEKKPERVFLEDSKIQVVLPPDSKALHLLERIRNEAHRFAVSFHRASRKTNLFRSSLDAIPQIGPKRKKELLKAFGSISAIKEASPEDVKKACNIPIKLAEKIISTLKKTSYVK
jgi:excinuclease ABC subunit C